jgi:hypothetical protein
VQLADQRDAVAAGARARRVGPGSLAGVAVVVLVALPVVVGAVALVGQRWLPLSDWASLAFRTSEVGTRDTPLVGPYSYHGFAHPGPLSYLAAAPLYRLMDGDPRSLLWSGAILNTAMVLAIGAVAWRRGRWPLLLAVLLGLTALLHGLGPAVTLDLWNPYSPLLPFLLAVLLVWDAGLGRSRALVEAAVPAAFAMQTHLAFVPLMVVVVAWYVAWTRGRGRVVPDTGTDGDGGGGPPAGEARAVRRAAIVTGVLWIPPLLDALFDLHNPWHVARALGDGDATVGPVDAFPIVGRYVALNGRWLRGTDNVTWLSPHAVEAVHVVLAAAVLAACLVVARRRRLVDVAALASLALALLAASLAATAQLVSPPMPYLAEWLKIVGALVWLTAGWTVWRLVEPALPTRSTARRAVAGLAVVAIAAGAAAGAGTASDVKPPHGAEPGMIAALREGWRERLDPGDTYRFDVVGDPFGHYAGLVYWMVRDDLDIVTSDGAAGLKWGHDHRWLRGDEVDGVVTVAVRLPGQTEGAPEDCRADSRVDEFATWAGLSPAEQRELADVLLQRLDDPGSVTPADSARADALQARDYEVVLFVGDRLCGQRARRSGEAQAASDSELPVPATQVAYSRE